jgi:hypothetical protein
MIATDVISAAADLANEDFSERHVQVKEGRREPSIIHQNSPAVGPSHRRSLNANDC